jgi:hypothetical protein
MARGKVLQEQRSEEERRGSERRAERQSEERKNLFLSKERIRQS